MKIKILHTADLHLKEGDEQRWSIFEWICQKASEQKVNFLLLAGDVFDSARDASPRMIGKLRESFEQLGAVKVIIIPGNHDRIGGPDPFVEKNYYGNNITICRKEPYEIVETPDIFFYCFPFKTGETGRELLKGLRVAEPVRDKISNRSSKKGFHIGVMHGTLVDEPEIRGYAEEVLEKEEYFPIYNQEIERSGFDYLALGHIHKGFWQKRVGETVVVYPGTPGCWSINAQEERKISLITLSSAGIDVTSLTVEPALKLVKWPLKMMLGEEEETVSKIKGYLKERVKEKDAKSLWIVVELGGLSGNIRKLNEELARIEERYKKKFGGLNIRTKVEDVATYLDTPICQRFIERAEKRLKAAGAPEEELRLSTAIKLGLEALRKKGRLG